MAAFATTVPAASTASTANISSRSSVCPQRASRVRASSFFGDEVASSHKSFELRKCVAAEQAPEASPSIVASATSSSTIRIGSRKSMLAMWQSEWVKARLEEAYPGREVDIMAISTKGDKILDVPLAKIGDKGLFTKELEVELIANNVDLVVHSLKDLQTNLPDELDLGAVSDRHDPSDALVIHPKLQDKYQSIDDLPSGTIVGTSSLRRIAQLRHYRDDLIFKDVRGNLQTRLKKLDDGEYDAIVLATAGLERLGYNDRVSQKLPPSVTLHAVGQGALGVEIRKGDQATIDLLSVINHAPTRAKCEAERAFMRELEGGCQVPIGVFTSIEGDKLTLTGAVLSLDGKQCVKETISGPVANAEALGIELANIAKSKGAGEILANIYRG
eukprot:tig00000241_g20908.t1